MGGGKDKGEWWRRWIQVWYYVIHCKNFHKCYNVPPGSTTI
jgi:hypothetical protein